MDNSQWNWFLTPSTTPTDSSFSPTSLHTPRTDSHFGNAFSPFIQHNSLNSTPIVNAEHAADQVEGDGQRLSEQHDLNDHHAAKAQYTQGRLPLQPTNNTLQPTPLVHTPPRARGTSDKRRTQRPHSIMFGTPTSMDQMVNGQSFVDHSEHFMLAQTQSPSQPMLPMAMDFSQFPQMPTNPAQDASIWDFSNTMSMNTLNQAMSPNNGLADPFTYQTNGHINMSAHAGAQNSQADFLATTPQLFTPVQPSPVSRLPTGQNSMARPLPLVPNDHAASFMSANHAIDPSNIYSSPMHMPPPAVPGAVLEHTRGNTQHHSLSPEGEPRKAIPSAAASLASTQLSFDSARDAQRPPSSGGLKSGLRRSHTVDSRRPHSMYGSIDSLSRSNTTAGVPRRASPLKRFNRNSMTSLASICESTPALTRSQTSVVLTVDSKGRARAETRTLEPSPSKLMLSRYSGLFEDSDTESDSDGTRSSGRRASIPVDKSTRAEKVTSTLASLEGLHLPRSSSSASNRVTPSKAAVAAAAQLRRQSSAKKSYHSRRNTAASSIASLADEDAMDTGSDTDTVGGDAGAALRKIMDRRSQHRESAAARQQARSRPQSQARNAPPSGLPPRSSSLFDLGSCAQQSRQNHGANGFSSHSHSQSFHQLPMTMPYPTDNSPQKSMYQQHQQQQQQQQQQQHHLHHHQQQQQQMAIMANGNSGSSPVKPTGPFADAMSSITRCICHLPIAENQLMLKCDSCHMWLHAACLGIPHDRLPPTYFCTFCMAAASSSHGNTAAAVGAGTTGSFGWEGTAAAAAF